MNEYPQQQRKKQPPEPEPLGRPTQALDEFLEMLLEPIEEYHPQQEVKEPPQAVRETPAVVVPVQPDLAPSPVPVEETRETVQTKVETVSEPPALPEYTRQPFQCLLFRASGAAFAIPLVTLHSIVKLSEEPASLPGQPAWHRGILIHREQRVGLVDLGRVIGEASSSEPSPFVIILDEGRFGLLATEIFRPQMLEQDQVKWRQPGTRVANDRAWMLGTLRKQLCPLIDTDILLGKLT